MTPERADRAAVEARLALVRRRLALESASDRDASEARVRFEAPNDVRLNHLHHLENTKWSTTTNDWSTHLSGPAASERADGAGSNPVRGGRSDDGRSGGGVGQSIGEETSERHVDASGRFIHGRRARWSDASGAVADLRGRAIDGSRDEEDEEAREDGGASGEAFRASLERRLKDVTDRVARLRALTAGGERISHDEERERGAGGWMEGADVGVSGHSSAAAPGEGRVEGGGDAELEAHLARAVAAIEAAERVRREEHDRNGLSTRPHREGRVPLSDAFRGMSLGDVLGRPKPRDGRGRSQGTAHPYDDPGRWDAAAGESPGAGGGPVGGTSMSARRAEAEASFAGVGLGEVLSRAPRRSRPRGLVDDSPPPPRPPARNDGSGVADGVVSHGGARGAGGEGLEEVLRGSQRRVPTSLADAVAPPRPLPRRDGAGAANRVVARGHGGDDDEWGDVGGLEGAFPAARETSGGRRMPEAPPSDPKAAMKKLDRFLYSPNHPRVKSSKSADATECSVCLDAFKLRQELRRFRCGHFFHQRCIGEWFKTGDMRCPMCRYDPWSRKCG